MPAIYDFNDLSSEMKTKLIISYDAYIQDANDDNRYAEGWYPVCMHEFLNNEFLYLLEEEGLSL